MTSARPEYYPDHDAFGTNAIAVQDSAFIFSGFPVGYIIPSAVHNGLWRWAALWLRYLDCLGIRNDDFVDTTSVYRLSDVDLSYANGGNVLTTGAVVQTRGVYLSQGRRIETNDALLNPIGASAQGSPLIYPGATAPGRIWIYASSNGQVRFDSVAAGTADTVIGSEIALVGVDINASGIVTDGAVAPSNTPLPAVQSLTVTLPMLINTLSALVLSAERITGTGNADTLPTITAQSSAGAATMLVTGNGSTVAAQAAINVDGDTGRSLRAVNLGTVAAIDVTHTGSGEGVLIDASGGSGTGLDVTATLLAITATCTGAGTAVDATAASGTAVLGATTSGTGVSGTSTGTGTAVSGTSSGSGDAFVGTGGPSALSSAGVFTATHVDATALLGVTAGGAGATAVAVRGSAFGDAIAVIGLAADGYGVYAQSDGTSPKRAAARIVPQDADPTTPLQGDLLFNSARGPTGKLRTYTTLYESVHSSDLGWVKQWGLSAAGGPIAGGSGNLSLAQITPEEVGGVLVTATGSLVWNTDTGTATVDLYDVTSALIVATQIERAPDIDGGAARQRSFVIRGIRTLPNTATRTFAVVITLGAGTGVAYSNVICSVEGVQ